MRVWSVWQPSEVGFFIFYFHGKKTKAPRGWHLSSVVWLKVAEPRISQLACWCLSLSTHCVSGLPFPVWYLFSMIPFCLLTSSTRAMGNNVFSTSLFLKEDLRIVVIFKLLDFLSKGLLIFFTLLEYEFYWELPSSTTAEELCENSDMKFHLGFIPPPNFVLLSGLNPLVPSLFVSDIYSFCLSSIFSCNRFG